MVYELLWLPAVLRNAGLKVAPVDGWESRGRAHMGAIAGVICHHTATARDGNMPSLRTLIDGRSDLRGPLAQLGVGRDGTIYVVAAGRCNHAGNGAWRGVTTGNTNFIGIEAENRGVPSDPWPDVQMDAYARCVAAILAHVGRDESACAGHKEYALPHGRKSDPSFDMDEFRATVAGFLNRTAAPRPMIPAAEPEVPGVQSRPTLRRNMTGDFVRQMQMKLGIEADGLFDADLEAKVRAFQRGRDLVPDGIVGPKTWAALDSA
ncbi:N-acetylmuramoyl-L-alanine amidase [Caballeronia sp. BCC1704]|uniref:peptidoglycan recognition protein family protein n=1 Tax=Caballeronia sp. BCC1704 TaxID=2676300 RepID=UPI00158D7C4F|nr:N-acetylmuramoyl-L-alanine amidase [Caballeronia sp. BCC1704]